MTDELAHIMVLHLGPFRREQRHFDADEHVESAWIPWSDLAATRITSSNSMIAIQHEALRRLIAGTPTRISRRCSLAFNSRHITDTKKVQDTENYADQTLDQCIYVSGVPAMTAPV